MLKKGDILKKAAVLFGVALVMLFLYHCPFRLIFGINCPGCGMTRAFLAAVRFDFGAAFRLHPLWPVFMAETAYAVLYGLTGIRLPVSKKLELWVAVLSLLLLLIVWIYRQFII